MNTANRKRTEIDALPTRTDVPVTATANYRMRITTSTTGSSHCSLSVGNRKRRLIDETRDDPAEKDFSAGLRPETGKHIKR